VLTFAPCSRFDPGRIILRNLHTMDEEFDGMRFAALRAEFRPVVSLGRQAVMYVHRPQFKGRLLAQRRQNVQQDDRIDTTRQS
jgi:hypothetical protein